MSFGMADRAVSETLTPAYWSRMHKNPGYKILKKLKYDFKTGCGRHGQGMVRPLSEHPKYGTGKVSDRLKYEKDRELKGRFRSTWRRFDVNRQSARYVRWFWKTYLLQNLLFPARRYSVVPYDYRPKPVSFVPETRQNEDVGAGCGSAA